MTPDAPAAGSDPDMTAGELALGLLDGDERAAALRRMLADPAFAREVYDWRDRLAGLFDDFRPVAAPDQLIDRLDEVSPKRAPARSGWSLAALAAALAAALVLFLITRPAPSPAPASRSDALMLATLVPADGDGPPIAAAVDVAMSEVRVAATSVAPAGKAAQLWIIKGGTPQSLGLLRRNGPTRIRMSAQQRAAIASDAVLAVSIEPPGGSPQPTPTGPVVASGPLTQA